MKQYWEQRGKLSYFYKQEEYYTITPIPVYYQRRKKLLTILDATIGDFIDNREHNSLLDFGCGDGFYLSYFYKKYPNLKLFGCDLSPSMISRAKVRVSDDCKFYIVDGEIPFEDVQYSFILAISVLGFIVEDDKVRRLVNEIYSRIEPGGLFIVFDAVASDPREAKTWKRRTEKWYIDVGIDAGFDLERKQMIAFPLYERFHKYVGRHLKAFYEKANSTGIELNRNWLFVKVVEIIVYLSPLFPFKLLPVKEGNCLFVFKK